MSDFTDLGVLYTEHARLSARTPVSSLWSYETCSRGQNRRSVTLNADGSREYWLDRTDPLLNTILPGTHVSLIFNFGDAWAAGRSLVTSELLPRVSVAGPITQPRILRVGRSVKAIGAVLPATLTFDVFDVHASELVDRIVALEELWPQDRVETLFVSVSRLDIRRALSTLRNDLLSRINESSTHEFTGQTAPRIITLHGGRVSIDALARRHGLSRQQFARRFCASAGLPPKLFARISRFQALVHSLLSTDVSQWASMSTATGFYDQAHMINEFRAFTGSSPTVFFRPHGGHIDPAIVEVRGRPSEWLRRR